MSRPALGSFFLSIPISAGCLWYAFRAVDLSAMAANIGQVGMRWVAASIAAALLGLIVRALRWRFLLAGGDCIGSWSLVSATFVGVMANNLLPARLGEVVRAWVLARRERVPVPAVLASVVIERLLDVVAALALLGVSLAVTPVLAGSAASLLKATGIVVLAAVAIAMSALLVAVRFRERVLTVVEGWAGCVSPRWASRGVEMGRCFLEGLCVLRTVRHAAAVAGLSFLVWIVAIASFHVLAEGFHLGLAPAQTTLVFVIVLFGIAIPSAPGFVGTFHGFCVAGLALVAGTDPTRAAAYATLLHASQWLAINMAGLGCLLADRSLSWTGMTRLIRQES